MSEDQEIESGKKGNNKKAAKKIRKGALLIVFEGLAVVLFLLMIAAGILVWRLTSGPLDLAFAKSTIEDALRDDEQGLHTTIDQVVLHWPDLSGPLLLGMKDVKNYNADDKLVFTVKNAAFSLNKQLLFIGRVAPEALILQSPAVRLERSGDNKFSVALGQNEKRQVEESGAVSDLPILDLISRPGQENKDGGFLSMLQSVRIEHAQLVIDDKVLGLSWIVPRFDAAFQSKEEGLIATYHVVLPKVRGDARDNGGVLEGDVLHYWDKKDVKVTAALKQFDLRLLGEKIPDLSILKDYAVQADLKVEADFNSNFTLLKASTDIVSEKGSLKIEEFGDEPLVYDSFKMHLDYDSGKRDVSVSDVVLSVGGVDIEGSGRVTPADHGYSGQARLEIDELAQEKIEPLWPRALAEDNAKEWVVDKLSEGVFSDAYADMTFALFNDEEGDLVFSLGDVGAGFSCEGMSVDYRSPMIPATNVSGKGTFDLKSETLRIDVDSGSISDLEVNKGTLIFTNIVSEGTGVADLDLDVQGPLKTGFEYISREPIDADPDMNLEKVKGQADLKVKVNFPTKDDLLVEDVKLDISGTLSSISLPAVVQDMDLVGGPFALKVSGNTASMDGSGMLAGRPIQLRYEEFLNSDGQPYSSKVTARLGVDEALRTQMGIDLSTFLSGNLAADIVYTSFQDDRAEAVVSADISSSVLFFEPFDYTKAVNQSGRVNFNAHLMAGELQRITDLTASAQNFDLASSVVEFRTVQNETELAGGKTGAFQVDQTKGLLEFEVERSGLVKIALDGEILDLRPFMRDGDEKKDTYENPPMQISVSVNKMRTSDTQVVKNAKLYADVDDKGLFNQLEMDAIAGDGAIYMRYKPDSSGKRVFRLEADDAGAALRAFEVYDDIQGGKLVVYGEPLRGVYDRNLIGAAEITNFRVVKAPSLARILGALSLPGLTSLLNNEGLGFTRLQADFDWLFRPGGSLLVLKEGRTSGNSLGFTFEGTFDNAKNMIDVSGTIIPLSGMNDVIGKIPLVGDILTGGSGGLFAATYSITGESNRAEGKEPDISVNPLSVLAPGILRRILFEN